MHPRVFVIFRGEISGPLWGHRPSTLGKAHRPFLLFAPGGFRRGRVTPGSTSHFMVFRPSSNALWGTVLTVPKVCKDPTSQNQITSSIPIPSAKEFPFGALPQKQPSANAEGCF